MNKKIVFILVLSLINIYGSHQLIAMNKGNKSVNFKTLLVSNDMDIVESEDDNISLAYSSDSDSNLGYSYDADEETELCNAFSSRCSSTIQSSCERVNSDSRSTLTRSGTPRSPATSFSGLEGNLRASLSLPQISELSDVTMHEDMYSLRSDSVMSYDSDVTHRPSSGLAKNFENTKNVGLVVKSPRYAALMMTQMRGDTEQKSLLGKRKRDKNDNISREDDIA